VTLLLDYSGTNSRRDLRETQILGRLSFERCTLSATAGGYDAANMAEDIHQLISKVKLERVFIVGHDIGGHVAYAFVRRYPQITRGAMILDTPIPGIEGWSEIQGHPIVWHIQFMQVPGLPEKLVAGRPAAYLGYFFTYFAIR
jgi:pimeloyl-ACP methyl ester carboxylesterase